MDLPPPARPPLAAHHHRHLPYPGRRLPPHGIRLPPLCRIQPLQHRRHHRGVTLRRSLKRGLIVRCNNWFRTRQRRTDLLAGSLADSQARQIRTEIIFLARSSISVFIKGDLYLSYGALRLLLCALVTAQVNSIQSVRLFVVTFRP